MCDCVYTNPDKCHSYIYIYIYNIPRYIPCNYLYWNVICTLCLGSLADQTGSSGHATSLASAERAPKCARVWDFGRVNGKPQNLFKIWSLVASGTQFPSRRCWSLHRWRPFLFLHFQCASQDFFVFFRELRLNSESKMWKDSIPTWIWGLLQRVKSFYDNIFVTWHEKNGGCSFVGWN